MYVRIIKRLLDLIISLIAFIILIPLFIIIALAIKTNSKGPVFFRQKRVACNKEYFNIYKFRTMYQETPHYAFIFRSDIFYNSGWKFLKKDKP